MKLFHLVANVDPINYGVWHAVVASWSYLKEISNTECLLCYPDNQSHTPAELQGIVLQLLSGNPTRDLITLSALIDEPSDTVVISHGVWSYQSRLAILLKNRGLKWVAVPHGMLEPWSMRHKWLKKQLYYTIAERKRLLKADALIAVGFPEYENLSRRFSRVEHVPNGIEPFRGSIAKEDGCLEFLFLGRLHRKKNIVALVRAWIAAGLAGSGSCRLRIAGPDEGELAMIRSLIASSAARNISVEGPVYGAEKDRLLRKAHFFVLPSHSEGFPTSVLEGMTYGCVPMISRGCNFPEAFSQNLAIESGPSEQAIIKSLRRAASLHSGHINQQSLLAKKFVDERFDIAVLARQQYALYCELLSL